MKCCQCGMPILMHMKYLKNKKGDILCIDCFEKIFGELQAE